MVKPSPATLPCIELQARDCCSLETKWIKERIRGQEAEKKATEAQGRSLQKFLMQAFGIDHLECAAVHSKVQCLLSCLWCVVGDKFTTSKYSCSIPLNDVLFIMFITCKS